MSYTSKVIQNREQFLVKTIQSLAPTHKGSAVFLPVLL